MLIIYISYNYYYSNMIKFIIITLFLIIASASIDQPSRIQSGILTLTNFATSPLTSNLNFIKSFSSNTPQFALSLIQFDSSVDIEYQILFNVKLINSISSSISFNFLLNSWNYISYNWFATDLNQILCIGIFSPTNIASSNSNFTHSFTFNNLNSNIFLNFKFDIFIAGFDLVSSSKNLKLNISVIYTENDYNLKYADYVTQITNINKSFASLNSNGKYDVQMHISYTDILINLQISYILHPVTLTQKGQYLSNITTGFNSLSISQSTNKSNLFISKNNKNTVGSLNPKSFYGINSISLLIGSNLDFFLNLTQSTSVSINSYYSNILFASSSYYFFQALASFICPQNKNKPPILIDPLISEANYSAFNQTYSISGDGIVQYVNLFSPNSPAIQLIISGNTITITSIMLVTLVGTLFKLTFDILDCAGSMSNLFKYPNLTINFSGVNIFNYTATFNSPFNSSSLQNSTLTSVDSFYRSFVVYFYTNSTQGNLSITLSDKDTNVHLYFLKNIKLQSAAQSVMIDPEMIQNNSSNLVNFYNITTIPDRQVISTSSYIYLESTSNSPGYFQFSIIRNNPIVISVLQNVNFIFYKNTIYKLTFNILDSACSIPSHFSAPTLQVLFNQNIIYQQTANLDTPYCSSSIGNTVLTYPLQNFFLYKEIYINYTNVTKNATFRIKLFDQSPVSHLYWINNISLIKTKSFLNATTSTCVNECPSFTFLDLIRKPSICLNCSAQGKILDPLSNLCVCPISTYNYQNLCLSCIYSCATCDPKHSQQCLTCLPNRSLNLSNLCKCNNGFLEINYICQSCSYSCLTCQISIIQCTSCPLNSGRNLNSLTNTCDCIQGYFDDKSSAICKICNYKCLTCTGSSSYNCLTCNNSNNRILIASTSQNGFQCVCMSGYVETGASPACSPIICDISCLICTGNTSSNCLTCPNTRKLLNPAPSIGGTSCICELGYIQFNPPRAECQICHFSCLNCTGPNSNDCISCPQNSFRKLSNLGTCDCITGYLDKNYKICNISACQLPGCSTCDLNLNECVTCNVELFRTLNKQSKSCDCIQGYYETNNICQICGNNCQVCNLQGCKTCYTNATYTNNQCKCPQGTFSNPSISTCSVCGVDCIRCTNQTECLQCTSQNNKILSDTQKRCVCIQTYYLPIGQINCQLCPLSCLKCTSVDKCQSCAKNFYLYNDSCITSCPSKTYSNQYICSPCILNCQICDDGKNCLTCSINFNLFNQNACINICPNSYFSSNGVCIKCSLSCKACTGSSTNCSSCESSYVYYPTTYACLTDCPTATFLYQKVCYNNCPQNTYIYQSACFASCPANTYQYSNTCVINCPNLYFASENKCLPCATSCYNCNVTSTNCTSCQGLLYLYNNICISTCPSGTFKSNSNCIACNKECLTCLTSAGNCLICNKNYKFSNNKCILNCSSNQFILNQACVTCPSSCLTCTSSTKCITCIPNYFVYNGNCINQCPSGTYLFNKNCISCASTCYTCNLASTSCTSCQGLLSLYNKACVSNCPSGTYPSSNICNSCDNSCLTCTNSPKNCSSCPKNYRLNSKYQCVLNCVSNQYLLDQICITCPSSCLTCTSSTNCNTCIPNYFVYNGNCINKCPSGTYLFNKNCISCSQSCSSCTDSKTCKVCLKEFYLYNSICVQNCPSSTFSSGNICQKCPSNCDVCINSTYCKNCSPKNYIYNGTCYVNCPSTTYLSNDICVSCQNFCNSCLNSTSCQSCIANYILLNGICITCKSPCATCAPSNSTYCLTCISKYLLAGNSCVNSCNLNQTNMNGICICKSGLQYQGNCVSSCQQGYVNISGICVQCDISCMICEINVTNCLRCNIGYKFANNNECVLSSSLCQYGQYLTIDLVCVNSCPNKLLFYNNYCFIVCPDSKIPNSIGTGCITCQPNQVLYQGKCLTQCPSTTYKKSYNCQSCGNNCQICTSQISCLTCITGYTLISGTGQCCLASQSLLNLICVNSCPLGTKSLNNICNLICTAQYYNVLDGKCYSKCPTGTLQVNNYLCQKK